MPEVNELRNILETGDITALFSQEELRECPRLSSSLVNLPTYLHCNEALPDEVMRALSKNKAAHRLILEHFPHSMLAKSLRGSVNDNERPLTPEIAAVEVAKKPKITKLKRKVSSLFKTKPLRPILKKPAIERDASITQDFEIERLAPSEAKVKFIVAAFVEKF